MRRTRIYGPYFSTRDRVEMDHLGDLQAVRAASAEVYEWEGPPRQSSSSGHETSRVVVLRQAFGDPRAIKGEGGVDRYFAPATLPNGVLEFAPTKANVDTVFGPTGGKVIYTFADGTWVQVDGWMSQRFHAAFSVAGSPPLPPWAPGVAWEVCALFDPKETIRSGVWGVAPQRGVLRFFAGGAQDGEMVYRFATPDLAARAAAEQRARCSQPAFGEPHDKGIFSLTPPCTGVVSTSLDGPMLRYVLRF